MGKSIQLLNATIIRCNIETLCYGSAPTNSATLQLCNSVTLQLCNSATL